MRRFLPALLVSALAMGVLPVAGSAQPGKPSGPQVALQFEWKSTKPYAAQFHDVVQFKSASIGATPTGSWVRLSATPTTAINEDRVTLMIEDPARPVPNFASQGCYVTCHDDMNDMPNQRKTSAGALVDARHYLLPRPGYGVGSFGVDMWHWRGGRSGPMGYAEDTWVRTHETSTGAQGRVRDAAPAKPTAWLASTGDNLHENQSFGGTVSWKDTPLPRFVFDPDRSGFGTYFLGQNGTAFTSADQLKAITNDQYRTQMVVYQDFAFDPVDKVNAIDVRYLLFRAGAIADPGYGSLWHQFWASRLPSVDSTAAAVAMLDDIAGKTANGVMVTRVVGFIYPSSQHDISSRRAFAYDPARGTWKVTMYRALLTSSTDDVDLSSLLTGASYNFAVGVHDIVIDDGLTHHVSVPLKLGTAGDVVPQKTRNVRSVDWAALPSHSTTLYQPGTVSLEFLRDGASHDGASGVILGMACVSCHSKHDLARLSAPFVPAETSATTVPMSIRAAYDLGPTIATAISAVGPRGLVVHPSRASIAGTLTVPVEHARSNYQVRLEQLVGTSWVALKGTETTASAEGAFRTSFVPSRTVSVRASYAGTDLLDPSASTPVVIKAGAALSVPRVPSTADAYRHFAVSGVMKPAHASTVSVRLYKGTRSGFKFVSARTVKTTTSGKWATSYSLPKGVYRFISAHQDAGHYPTRSLWSSKVIVD